VEDGVRSGGGYEERSFCCESIRRGVVSTRVLTLKLVREQESEAYIKDKKCGRYPSLGFHLTMCPQKTLILI